MTHIIYSIIIPCYNEEKNIRLILDRFSAIIDREDIEVILVNNGSTDQTAQHLSQLLSNYPFARTIDVKKNQGYGYGIMAGLHQAKGLYIGWTHADMQTDPYDVIRAIEILSKSSNPEKTYIKGNRKKRRIWDQFFTIGMSLFESLYLKMKLWDINAQPNLFHKSFFKSWVNPPYDFSLDLYALYQAKKQRLDIKRFSVNFPERIHGKSTWNTGIIAKWKFIKRTIAFSNTLKKNLKKQTSL